MHSWLSKVYRSTKYIIISHIRDGFSRVKRPNQQYQALKKDRVQIIRLQSHQVHPTVLHYDIYAVCKNRHNTNTYTQMNTMHRKPHSQKYSGGNQWQDTKPIIILYCHLSISITNLCYRQGEPSLTLVWGEPLNLWPENLASIIETSLYRVVQNAFQYLKPLRVNHKRDKQTDGQTDREKLC